MARFRCVVHVIVRSGKERNEQVSGVTRSPQTQTPRLGLTDNLAVLQTETLPLLGRANSTISLVTKVLLRAMLSVLGGVYVP